METLLDALAIQKLLPHRYPFLLVDRIVELVPRERIVGIKQVSINESFFQGHFPGAPVMALLTDNYIAVMTYKVIPG